MPDWAEAAGTIGGLGYLAVQYHKAQKRDRDLKEQELRRTQDAEAAQARLVAMNNVSWKPDGQRFVVSLTVHNDSDRAIRDVAVEVVNPEGKGLLPRTPRRLSSRARDSAATGYVGRLTADESVELRFDPEVRVLGHLATAHEVSVSFTDAAGLRWATTGVGPPVRQFQIEVC